MKTSQKMALIFAAASACSLLHWKIQGQPVMAEIAEVTTAAELGEHEILADELLKKGRENILFIDARKHSEWQRDGIRDSLSLTTLSKKSIDEQFAEHADQLMQARTIAIYCNAPPCSLSHDLANIFLRDYKDLLSGELYVVFGGLPALRKVLDTD